MKTVIGVKFRKPGKIYFFDPENLQIKRDDYVIVETRGWRRDRKSSNR